MGAGWVVRCSSAMLVGGRCTEGFLFATGGVGVSGLTKLVLSEVIRDPPSIVFENS